VKHEHITQESQEQAALCALGAASQQEARAFATHVSEGCAVCERELSEFEEVVGLLALASEPVAPPDYLRELLAARIQREQAPTPAPVIPLKQPLSASTLSRAWLPWAIAAALLVAFAFSLTMWRTERRKLEAETDRANAAARESAELRAGLDKQSAMSKELAEINSVLSASEWRIIPLAGQEPAPSSSARIYWDIPGKRWVVTADLPPVPEGKVYQLWFVTPEAKISAGLITPDASGHGFAVIEYPSSVGHLAAAAITLEPEGGSQQPTLPIYALGKAS
jgi:hypothetical protein